MILVDVHAHMDFPHFAKDLPEVLERAKNAGMAAIISQGVHHASNKRTLELAAKYPLLKPALGLYPLNAPNVEVHEEDNDDFDRHSVSVAETLKFIKQHAKEITAIGEVGIDLKYSDDEQTQISNFMEILRLSNQIKKPVIIHSRKAEKLVLDILEDAKHERAVLHCFSGGKKLIKRAVQMKLPMTVTSNANKLQHFQMVAREVPITQLLTETDAPYLSPIAGERNEPQNVKVAVEVIAKEKGLNVEEVARSIYMNYQRYFL
jgi:TatD DNase family protein